jgi:alkyl hydroperoxide reductase subunit D
VQLEEGRKDPSVGVINAPRDVVMSTLQEIAESFPDAARDVRMNLSSVLAESSLEPRLAHAVALASALAVKSEALAGAIGASDALDEDAREDARASAALMAMNNVFYRFRHMVGKPAYSEMSARLRMTRLAKPRMPKVDFELLSLAVSAIHGCEACVRAHEKAVLEGGRTEANVLDAVRIASVVHAAASAAWMARAFQSPQDPVTR